MKLLTLDTFYVIAGIFLLLVSGRTAADRAHPKRWGSALFWGLLGLIFLLGQRLPPVVVGYLVLVLVGLAATRRIGESGDPGPTAAARAASSQRLGNWLFWPALIVPATAVMCTLFLGKVHAGAVWLFDSANLTVASVCLGALVAAVVGLKLTKARPMQAVGEGSRLLQAIGWALILPQLLAALGGIFARAGVGAIVAEIVAKALPVQLPFVAVVAYCAGMTLFTVCMGNAFAAFPVITLGIGLPFIVVQHHGNAAIMAAIGMLSGYCGTLMTPMAANFNIVPAMLLELRDPNAVIRAQLPIALGIFVFNLLLMEFCVFRF